MVWVCQECSSNNDGALDTCFVCGAKKVTNKICTLTAKRVLDLGLSGHVTIPSEYNSIGEEAFKNRGDILSVTFHPGVKRISREAFFGCKNLRELKGAVGLSSIGGRAFAECTALPREARLSARYLADDAYFITPARPVPPRPAPPAPPRPAPPRPAPAPRPAPSPRASEGPRSTASRHPKKKLWARLGERFVASYDNGDREADGCRLSFWCYLLIGLLSVLSLFLLRAFFPDRKDLVEVGVLPVFWFGLLVCRRFSGEGFRVFLANTGLMRTMRLSFLSFVMALFVDGWLLFIPFLLLAALILKQSVIFVVRIWVGNRNHCTWFAFTLPSAGALAYAILTLCTQGSL